MPAQPSWFHRLEEIIATLQTLQALYLDRLAVEKLFQVRERRARQIMSGLPGLQVGNAWAIERLALIAHLRMISQGEHFHWELVRRTRLAGEIERSRRQNAAARLRIPVPSGSQEGGLQQLPGAIELEPGQLRICFEGAADLAAKLYQLSQAMVNDWPAFLEKAGS